MRTVDQITSFLNNEMAPGQEREFLLSVAASDSLRLALKSHVMLDRIFTTQLEHANVPDAVRERIFSEMRASMAHRVPMQSAGTAAAALTQAGSGLYARLISKAGWTLMVALLTLGGFTAGYFTGTELSVKKGPEVSTVAVPVTPRDIRRDAPAPSSVVTDQAPASSSMSLSTEPAGNRPAEQASPQLNKTALAARRSAQTSTTQSAYRPSVNVPVSEPSTFDPNASSSSLTPEVKNAEKSIRNGENEQDGGTKIGVNVNIRKPTDSDRSNKGTP